MRLANISVLPKKTLGVVGDGDRTHFRSNVYRDAAVPRNSFSVGCPDRGPSIVVITGNCGNFISGTNVGNDISAAAAAATAATAAPVPAIDFISDKSVMSRSSSFDKSRNVAVFVPTVPPSKLFSG